MNKHPNFWPYPKLIAHRGAGHFAPENTLASMRVGAQHGFTMVEYDVKLSQDGVPILLHDDTVDRTSNGRGNAAQLSLHDLVKLDFGAWHSNAYAGEPIATLYAIAAFTQANGLASNIEIKPCPNTEAATGTAVAQYASRLWAHASVPPLLSSFSQTALEAALKTAPRLPRALLIDGAPPLDWRQRADHLKCIAININEQYATKALIQEIHNEGYKIGVWTVNNLQRARTLFNWGCDAVFTDEIKTITPHL